MIQDALKGFKDAMAGFLLMALGVLSQGIPMSAKIALVAAGAIVAVLGVVTNTVQKDFGPIDTWGKVAKDCILGICAAAIPIIQNGAQSQEAIVGILFAVGIASLSVFANVVSSDVTATTIFSKIAKDFGVAGSLALGTTFEATKGQPLSIVLSAAGVALLGVFSNVVKGDVFGLPDGAKAPVAAVAAALATK